MGMLKRPYAPMPRRGGCSLGLTACYLYLLDFGDDFGGEEVKGFQLVDVWHAEDGLVDAHGCLVCEMLDGSSRGHCSIATVASQVDPIECGLLNLLVWTANCLAVIAQDIEFMLKLILFQTGEEVASVSILGDHAQGLALATPTDENGRMRFL